MERRACSQVWSCSSCIWCIGLPSSIAILRLTFMSLCRADYGRRTSPSYDAYRSAPVAAAGGHVLLSLVVLVFYRLTSPRCQHPLHACD